MAKSHAITPRLSTVLTQMQIAAERGAWEEDVQGEQDTADDNQKD